MARRMLETKVSSLSHIRRSGAAMLPLTVMIAAFYLGEFFCERSQPLTGVLVFLAVALGGVILSCYLEAVIRHQLKGFLVRTVAAHPHLFWSRKPRPAASHPS